MKEEANLNTVATFVNARTSRPRKYDTHQKRRKEEQLIGKGKHHPEGIFPAGSFGLFIFLKDLNINP